MNTFKPGDRVSATRYAKPGVVIDVDRKGRYTYVTVDVNDPEGIPTTFLDIELELIVDKPVFNPGDHVEYRAKGFVKSFGADNAYMIVELDGKESFVLPGAYKYLTKIAPRFPTRVGSVIKAKYSDKGQVVWTFSKSNGGWLNVDSGQLQFFSEHDLELISVEYEPSE